MINKKKFSLDVEIFREILQICPKIPRQEFEDLPLEQDILSFIRDLRHSGDITYLTDVSVDYLHQPWRAFAIVINKCLSGKETRMNKIRMSLAQILWGMFYKKNIHYVYLLWEDFLFQVENKDTKKKNKMSYPRFIKIIINHFMSKDQSISRRNKMFWHTARDDAMFNSMRCISRHEDTQMPKAKGLTVLSEVALTEAEQMKLATERSKRQFHSSHASGSGDGVDTQSKVPDEQQQKTSGTDEGTGTIPRVPDVPKYDSESKKESWGDSDDEDDDDEDDFEDDDGDNDDGDKNDDNDEDDNDGNDDDEADSKRTESDRAENIEITQSTAKHEVEEEEEYSDQIVYTPSDYQLSEEEEKNDDEGMMDEEEEEDEQVEEDSHVIVTPVIKAQKADDPVQSSSVSSDFTSKLLNLDNTPPRLDETSSQTSSLFIILVTAIPKITSATTVHLPHPFFNHVQQEATPTPTPTTSEATTSTLALPNFASVFRFNKKVTNLEKYLSEMKHIDQYATTLSSIPAIVDRYIENKLGEAINKSI
ncbi:hypothetical protein Tco_0873089 [Tanacetum coccineum]